MIVVAIDSFKGSLTSLEAGQAIQEGLQKITNEQVYISPVADGGEGTVEALVKGMGGSFRTSQVTGPLGSKVEAGWGIIEEKGHKTAIIEMAEAAGIALIERANLNPLKASTYGVGELIKAAIDQGCRRFIIGIGGSATNDGGVGMLQALGYEFLDREGRQISLGAQGLKDLSTISRDKALPELQSCTFRVACDVTNPLCGVNGCSSIYGPQKGATPEMIQEMDHWLANYAKLSKGDKEYPGTGAAGGLGYAFRTFLGASLEPGIDIVLEETGLEDRIKDSSLVITGEGRMDAQTIMGKAPVGVARIAKKYNKKVIAFCGSATREAALCNQYGIDAFFPILREVVSLEEALDKERARDNLMDTVEQVGRVMMK